MSDEIQKKINKLYQNSGYMVRYGADMWISAILCIVFTVLTVYFYYTNILQVVKSNWEVERCNPIFIPFAGLINKSGTSKSSAEYTISNFTSCMNSFLMYIVEVAIAPIQYAIIFLQESIQEILDSIDSFRGTFSSLRGTVANIIKQIYTGISNLIISMIEFVVKMKDSLAKISGILTTTVFSLFGSYMAMQSLFLIIIDLIILILIIISVIIIVYIAVAIALFVVPVVGPGLASAPTAYAVLGVSIMVAILVPVVMMKRSMMRIMRMSTPPTPSVPGCFAKNTLIEMYDGTVQEIKYINLGDKLKNESIVTACILFDASEQNIYKLHEVFVTGEHRVFHPEKKWIKVKDHPDSLYIPLFNEPVVYCLNTDKKMFTIGDTIFSDWDDIDENVLADLQKNCVSVGYLPDKFTFADIHTHLDSGFHRDTEITLHNGKIVKIVDIKVNDILITGEKVLGLIIISAYDMDVYTYSFAGGKSLCGTENIHINDPILGVMNGFQMDKVRCEGEMCLFHLLTDSKFFIANNIRVNDYNSGIDRYLESVPGASNDEQGVSPGVSSPNDE